MRWPGIELVSTAWKAAKQRVNFKPKNLDLGGRELGGSLVGG